MEIIKKTANLTAGDIYALTKGNDVRKMIDAKGEVLDIRKFVFYTDEDVNGNEMKVLAVETVDGIRYSSVSVNELRNVLTEQYGPVYINFSYGFDTNEGDPMDQSPENSWQVGDSFSVEMRISLEESGEMLYKDDLTIRVCETEIKSVSIAPITYYAYQRGSDPEITVTNKDGTTKKSESFFYDYADSWPEEPGSYTMDFTVLGQFQVSVPVTVLATPTSGKLGEKITWSFDASTNTLTISGSGATYYYSQHIADGDEELNLWMEDWSTLLLNLQPKKVVVEEGIEYLPKASVSFASYFYFTICLSILSISPSESS